MKKPKSDLKKWFPLLFFFSVFSFMLFFRHEIVFTKGDARSIESVTYSDEWLAAANIPEDLKVRTAAVDGPLRSRIIHRMMEEEKLTVVYVPSVYFAKLMAWEAESESIFDGKTMPTWAEKAALLVREKYHADLLQWKFFDPEQAAPVYPENKGAADFLKSAVGAVYRTGRSSRQPAGAEGAVSEERIVTHSVGKYQQRDEQRSWKSWKVDFDDLPASGTHFKADAERFLNHVSLDIPEREWKGEADAEQLSAVPKRNGDRRFLTHVANDLPDSGANGEGAGERFPIVQAGSIDRHLPTDQTEEEAPPIYLEAARSIRAMEPDVVLFDLSLLVEHFEAEHLTYRDVVLVTREFLQTLYRSHDRFYTVLLIENDVYERLGYMEHSENLDEYMENLADQMDYTAVKYIGDFYQEEKINRIDNVYQSIRAGKIAGAF
ncbi:hypothetical protein SAMN05421736_113108 [Evansella caseinilytica]|uniref:Uncharacterized protein n=1 Tax=Evansella caseinilytica TaxID=1503961 RepID=A0A1H3T7W5_9BACI|nr:hypothetical protein [Evansella caseinilytica]SDZ46433.1 hypothetical protein SAMN05421736_113108 [Evansella caseinilytica]